MDTKPRYSANVRRVSVLSARRKTLPAGLDPAGKLADSQDDGHVKVAVRCRPMSTKEASAGHEPIVEFESSQRIVVHDVSEQPSDQLGTKSGERRNVSHVYDFDYVFDCEAKQQDVYDRVCRPIVDSVLEGYNGTIFAYGQTGTGKTFTMEGPLSQRFQKAQKGDDPASSRPTSGAPPSAHAGNAPPDKDQAGIIPRAFDQIFTHIQSKPDVKFLIRASYLEVYQEEIRDLLRKDKTNKLELHERTDIGVYVRDLTSFVCKSIGEIERVMRVGNQNRIVGATDMNEHSSRSHAIFTITIEQQLDTKLPSADASVGEGRRAESESTIRVGKLNLVDLAGSERQRKTNSFGQRQKESIKINSSLSALGNVITALMKLQKQRNQPQLNQAAATAAAVKAAPAASGIPPIHTPYRDSKLTRLLQDSLGGTAKTLMIANIGPASYNYDETINTLNYASRARCIKNKPRLNEDPKDALLRELQREIESLRAKLAANQGGCATSHRSNQTSDNQSSGVSSAKSSSRGSSGADATGRKASLAAEIGGNNKINNNNHNDELLVEKEFLELKQKLASLESKLLNGSTADRSAAQLSPSRGQDLDHQSLLKGLTREQELELERRQGELADQARRERAIRDELERREEAELLAKQSFESVQQEIEAKRKLIWQILVKVKAIRDEMNSTQQAYRIELDELEQIQFVLQRELKLKCLIMDNFIPNDHVDQLISRVNYDERQNSCFIRPLKLPGPNDRGNCLACVDTKSAKCLSAFLRPQPTDSEEFIRPRCELERLSETINPSNIRYKSENLLEPELSFIHFGPARHGQTKTPLDSPDFCQVKPRRLCDTMNARRNDSASESSDLTGEGKDFTGQLQAMISEALSKREPDIVI